MQRPKLTRAIHSFLSVPLAILFTILVGSALILTGGAGAEEEHHHLFMDVHHLGPGNVTAEGVAEAHRKDLAVQDEFGVRFLEYWYNEDSGTIHCLAEAPDADAVRAAHEKAHGLVPDEVREVVPGH